jgi:uncharacterized membrane protein YfcA
MVLSQVLILVILSLSIGFLMGIIGGGGGGLYIIVLMFFLNLDIQTAIGTALLLSTITLSSASFQYWKRKQVRIDYFFIISIFGIIGVYIGSSLITFINENLLKILIVSVFVLSGTSSLFKIKSPKKEEQEMTNASKKLPILIPLGIFSGLITGALGLSGTVPLSAFLIGLLDFSPFMAVGTTILITLVLNFSGAIFHIETINLNIKILIIFATGSVLGALFGAKIATKLDRKILTLILGVLAITSGIYLAIHK